MTQKLLEQIERDIRNQVLFDQMKRLNRRQRLMVFLRRNSLVLAAATLGLLWILFCCTALRADEIKPQCPDPGVKCKILFLSEQEEHMLMGQNGILDTAAQARSLDLGQFAVYLKTRIAAAPAGEIRSSPNGSDPTSKQSPEKPADGTINLTPPGVTPK
jgi:hypothetical protein